MVQNDYLLQKYIFEDYDNQKNYPKTLYRYKIIEQSTMANLKEKLLKALCQFLIYKTIFSSFYVLEKK